MIGSKMRSKIDFLINKDKEYQETGSCTEEIDKKKKKRPKSYLKVA